MQIELKPGAYREVGRERRLSDAALKRLTIASAVWCAVAIYFFRYFFPVEPGWWAYAAGALPGFALFLWVALTD